MTFGSFATAILEFAIGNVVIALPLGLLAWWLQRGGRQPFLAHLLWLVVLLKLVTPPLYALRIVAPADPGVTPNSSPIVSPAAEAVAPASDPGWLASGDWQIAVAGLWLAGSAFVLGWTLIRAYRFNRLLGATSTPAAAAHRRAAAGVARMLGLKQVTPIRVTAARVSPLVWWVGGPVCIYLPRAMVQRMDQTELSAILAHELGHVKRGDHYVRWLECLVCVALWWNPIAWWARRNLRVCEEICCDAFVLSKTEGSRDAYAGALVSAMELLAVPSVRPLGLASHVNGGFIERRIRMILSGQTISQTPRWLRGLVIASAVLLLPLGFTLAQDADDDLDMVRQWLDSGVNSAFLTREQADIMLSALEASQYEYAVSFVDESGNVVNLSRSINEQPDEVRVVAERVMADPATGTITLHNGTVEVGDFTDGHRVVKVATIPGEAGHDAVIDFEIVRHIDGQPDEIEVIRSGPAE
jgi:beta-lactamase regulating signal transducer with metallopeptidase domain